jgi:hypothetical protein
MDFSYNAFGWADFHKAEQEHGGGGQRGGDAPLEVLRLFARAVLTPHPPDAEPTAPFLANGACAPTTRKPDGNVHSLAHLRG